MPKLRGQLDSRIEIVTPENIAFKYRVAGPFRRAPAYLIDLLIRATTMFVVLRVVDIFRVEPLVGLSMVFWFVLSWFYGGLFETYWNGQTPGKRALGIRVVSIDGQPVNALQAVMRNVLRAADALPAFPIFTPMGVVPLPLYQLGLLAPAFNERYQRLGDLACGTMVVVEESPRLYGVARVTIPEAIRLAGLIPVSFEPSRSLARALSVYVERRGGFAVGRRAEIARHLAEPLRIQFNLPTQTSYDLLLCAVYYRAFIADRAGEPVATGRRQPPAAQPRPASAKENRSHELENMLDRMA
jgi:uncharacterized RDD family membrane protein YckC